MAAKSGISIVYPWILPTQGIHQLYVIIHCIMSDCALLGLYEEIQYADIRDADKLESTLLSKLYLKKIEYIIIYNSKDYIALTCQSFSRG